MGIYWSVGENRVEVEVNLNILSSAGSRLTNFVGILSQGLRIAPPEAPATGYMVLSLLCVCVCILVYLYLHEHVIY